MRYFVLTRAGRQVISLLGEKSRGDEADILDYLRKNGASTAEGIADGLPMDESSARLKLMMLRREGWVKEKRTKTVM